LSEAWTCRQLTDVIADYLAGGLQAMARAEFDRHLAICPTCVDYLETYRLTIALVRACAADAAAAPAEVPEELIQAILAARRQT
jgi:anti-sigma factor RsiW